MAGKDLYRKDIDAVYPEHLSRLHRGTGAFTGDLAPQAFRRMQKKSMHRGATGRFRTQPVTFDEIQEVDEDVSEEITEPTAPAAATSEQDLQQRFQEFRALQSSRRALKARQLCESLPCSKVPVSESSEDCKQSSEVPSSASSASRPRPSI